MAQEEEETPGPSPGQPSAGEGRLKRALEKHGEEAVGFLVLAKSNLADDAYKELIKTIREIVKQSSCPEGGITVKKCEDILSKVFVGQTHVLEGFHRFLEGRHLFNDHDVRRDLQGAVSFLGRAKASPHVSDEDYNDIMLALSQCMVQKTKVEDTYRKVKKALRRCPDLIQTFETYLPDHPRVPPPSEQSCRRTTTSPTDKVVCITPDATHSLDGNQIKTMNTKSNVSQLGCPHEQDHEETEYEQKHTQRSICSFQMPTEGNGEPLYAQEDKGDKTDPLPDWSPSRESELPPRVNIDMCTRCTTSYYVLPENCSTLNSSYGTKLGQSIFNDTLVSATSGREDCFKFRTKNNYEETILKCEDDMFETDMLLQRYKATAEFIGNLQDHVDRDMKIQEHLTPLHRRCIEQLYDEHGLDMLDALCEEIDTSTAIAILHSRLNQKIEDLSEARLSLNKTCSVIIANNYHRSLDHCSSSFKQSDKKRMSRKALLAEAKEINMARLNNGDKHLSSACNNPQTIDLDIHKDIDRMIHYASKLCPSEQNPMMIWEKLVQPFVSFNCKLPESNGNVAPKEACEHCGLSKTFLRSIPDSSLMNNFTPSSKSGGYHVHMPNKSASIHGTCHTEIEEGEFIPDVGNIQLGCMLGPGNGAASYYVAAPSGDGSNFQGPGHSICDHGNIYGVHHESREGYGVEMGSLAYSKITAEPHDVQGSMPCCSLAMLLRLHQILYERLLVAKNLSRKASTCVLYEGFKKELCHLITSFSNSSHFEDYCLTFLGPKSYVLFTLNDVIGQIIKQLDKICPVAGDNSIPQHHEKVRGLDPPKDSFRHQNMRNSSPGGRPTNGSLLARDHQEDGEKGGNKHHDNTVKPMQNHFQRRKKRKMENSTGSIPRPGVDDLAPKRNS
ncbi:hypothetical protein BS78_09G255000 [Paspalum vaginatum]|nr:hypothetical protein BS78_09G255000 [Paspalum vaginatum]